MNGTERARLVIRVDLDGKRAVGPGKIRLLELIAETGSISAAGRALSMSYRRAWLLVDAVNRLFRFPAVEARPGGKAGGGAGLTPFGAELVARYRTMERDTSRAAAEMLRALEQAAVEPAEETAQQPPSDSSAGSPNSRVSAVEAEQ